MKKGISMIVLSITILVMAILAATVIISLEDSGIIGRSKNTAKKQTYIQEYERLSVIKNGILTDNFGEITVEEYIAKLKEKGVIETGETRKSDDSITVITKTGYALNIKQSGDTDLSLSLGESNATVTMTQTTLSGDVTSGSVNKTITIATSNILGDVVWTTNNPSVATVVGTNESATVTLKAPGTATITATYGNAKVSCYVTVSGTIAVPSIYLNKTIISKTIDVGTTATETITAITQNITGSLTWSSSNTSVATVSGSGNNATITIKGKGTTIITATYGSTSASCTVTVEENDPRITVSLREQQYNVIYNDFESWFEEFEIKINGVICTGLGNFEVPIGSEVECTIVFIGILGGEQSISYNGEVVAVGRSETYTFTANSNVVIELGTATGDTWIDIIQ